MPSRITIDFKDSSYLSRLKLASAEQHKSIREIVMNALDSYFNDYLENRAIKTLAEQSFAEWNNPLDADYDKV